METDLFTNVNKLCSSCDRVPKLGNCLEMYTCPSHCPICACPVYKLGHSLYTGATAWTILVHYRYCLGTPCTLHMQVLLGHSLYTRATAWAFLVHYTGTAWILLAHYTGTTWVLLVHIQYNDLGTLSTLQGYCFGTPGTLELYTCLGIPCQQTSLACSPLVHYLKSVFFSGPLRGEISPPKF